jgi:hypothetical protein
LQLESAGFPDTVHYVKSKATLSQQTFSAVFLSLKRQNKDDFFNLDGGVGVWTLGISVLLGCIGLWLVLYPAFLFVNST